MKHAYPLLRHILGLATLLFLSLSGCTPPQGIGESPVIAAEPSLAAPTDVTERKAMPSPCEDDDGIGGTGCPVE